MNLSDSFGAREPVYPEGTYTCRAHRRQSHVYKRKSDISCQSGDPGKSRFGLPAEYALVRDTTRRKHDSYTHDTLRFMYMGYIGHMYMKHMFYIWNMYTYSNTSYRYIIVDIRHEDMEMWYGTY